MKEKLLIILILDEMLYFQSTEMPMIENLNTASINLDTQEAAHFKYFPYQDLIKSIKALSSEHKPHTIYLVTDNEYHDNLKSHIQTENVRIIIKHCWTILAYAYENHCDTRFNIALFFREDIFISFSHFYQNHQYSQFKRHNNISDYILDFAEKEQSHLKQLFGSKNLKKDVQVGFYSQEKLKEYFNQFLASLIVLFNPSSIHIDSKQNNLLQRYLNFDLINQNLASNFYQVDIQFTQSIQEYFIGLYQYMNLNWDKEFLK